MPENNPGFCHRENLDSAWRLGLFTTRNLSLHHWSFRIFPLKSICAPDPFLANAGLPTLIDAQHAIAHNQVIVIDGEVVIGGSFNDTRAAPDKNAENVEITRDKALAAKYITNWVRHEVW
jgi:phosphatidylserine/phosphatidylglycerophosphate/cardiolipin synthase-like enzyme